MLRIDDVITLETYETTNLDKWVHLHYNNVVDVDAHAHKDFTYKVINWFKKSISKFSGYHCRT